MTLRDALTEASCAIARRDAETLLAHLLGCDRAWMLAHITDELDGSIHVRLRELVERRAHNEPLQYLTGMQEFYGLSLRVTPDVLIPRPETEHLVEAVLAWAAARSSSERRPLRVADVGTGSGAIAIALARDLPGAQITAFDLSSAALSVARENAAAHRCPDRIVFQQNDLLADVTPASFDVVVSNPPYVALREAPTLAPEVVKYEPHTALFAGDDGLRIYERLIPQAHLALSAGGLLALEFGFGQREALAALLEGWNTLRFLEDYAGIPRVALAER